MRHIFKILTIILFIQPVKSENLFLSSWQEVPFTNFSTQSNKFTLEVLLEDSTFRLKEKDVIIQFPDRRLPLKVLELEKNYIIFTRHLFSGKNEIYIVDKSDKNLKTVELPNHMDDFIFMQAQTCDEDILCIFYNVRSFENFLFLIKKQDDVYYFDEKFIRELIFGTKHISDHTLCIKTFKKKIEGFEKEEAYFIAGNVIFTYQNLIKPTLYKYAFPDDLDFLTLKLYENNYIGIFKDVSWENQNINFPIEYKTYDLINHTLIQSLPPEQTARTVVPSYTATKDLLLMTFIQDIIQLEPSGILNMGINNYEGLLVWSQAYYLNGFINILAFTKDKCFGKLFDHFKEKVRQRLDIEIYLLDQMISEDEDNLLSKRYSIDRAFLISSLHYARVLRILRRYSTLIDNPFRLKSYQTIINRSLFLDHSNNMDELVTAKESIFNLVKGQHYVKVKQAVPFIHDGINNAYNYMTQWIGEIQYCINERVSSSQRQAVIDITKLFFQGEGFQNNHFPSNYQWHYNWGWGKKGRTIQDKISINLPYYPPDPGIAHISYRTIDVIGLLSVAKKFPYIIPQGFVDYVANAVENNGVWPFAYEALFDFDKKIKLHTNVAWWYLRCNSAYQIESASIVLLYFLGDK